MAVLESTLVLYHCPETYEVFVFAMLTVPPMNSLILYFSDGILTLLDFATVEIGLLLSNLRTTILQYDAFPLLAYVLRFYSFSSQSI